MPELGNIPAAIWQKVVTYACVDGGWTGRSLALASKFLHSQSLSARFHSLAFTSVQQIEDFLLFLGRQPKECAPQIAHLYLAFPNEPVRPQPDFWDIYVQMTEAERDACGERMRQEWSGWQQRFCTATNALLTLAAPTLRTFCVAENGTPLQVFTVPCELPKLEELSWMGEVHAFDPYSLLQAGRSPRHPATFPALERVHFISSKSDKVVAALHAIGSSTLSHLRISNVGVRSHDTELPKAVAAALGVPEERLQLTEEDDGDIPYFLNATLPHLCRVIIHLMRPKRGEYYDGLYQDLESLARICEQRIDAVYVLLLESEWRRNAHWPERLRDDWVDRIQGGRGCWVESQTDEAAKLEIYPPESEEADSDDEEL
ncbi:hypothetical protein BV20DRAFT_1043236 [Pilatotrama ljubarskyi]|nr:hypothetical protein BV20DRAFT_1043236 [Pilatotrama ljubarskyi]